MKLAVIDIGTNTCLLLIAESERPGEMKVISDTHSIARLGAGVDSSKLIQPESYERLQKILHSFKNILDESKVDYICATGTSVLRDAANYDEIVEKVKNEFDISIEILSGIDESKWSYQGAVCGLKSDELQGAITALDIGGGSTELSIGKNGKYVSGKSINIGAVRIKERFLSTINEASIKSAREFIRSELQKTFTDPLQAKRLIAVAGTPTALAAMKLQLKTFDAEKVNGLVLTTPDLIRLCEEVLSLSNQELTEKYPAIHPSRADILPAGAIILEEVITFLGLSEIHVSTYGLRYGIMIREFERSMKSSSNEWLVTRE